MSENGPEEAKLSPEVSRRRLRLALKEAREASGLTQRDVAKRLSWSLSKVIRIEAGAVGVSVTDVRAMLDEYKVKDQVRHELNQLAITSKDQSWTAAFGKHISQQSLTLFALERVAKHIHKHETSFIPGLLQNTEYSLALLPSLGVKDPDRIEAIVNIRTERQELLRRPDHPELHFIIGEAPVSRQVGSNGVMRRQLRRLVELNREDGITIQLLAFSAGVHPKVDESFTLLEFEDEKMNDAVYLENAGRETVSRENPEEIAEYQIAFEQMAELAYPADQLEARLEEIITQRFSGEDPPVTD